MFCLARVVTEFQMHGSQLISQVGASLPEPPSASESEGTKSGDCGDRESPVEESFISVWSLRFTASSFGELG